MGNLFSGLETLRHRNTQLFILMHHSHKITSCFTGVAGRQVSLSQGLIRRYWWDARVKWAWDEEISHSRCRWGWWEQFLLCISTVTLGIWERTGHFFLDRGIWTFFLKSLERCSISNRMILESERSVMLCFQFPISHRSQQLICNYFQGRCFHLQS